MGISTQWYCARICPLRRLRGMRQLASCRKSAFGAVCCCTLAVRIMVASESAPPAILLQNWHESTSVGRKGSDGSARRSSMPQQLVSPRRSIVPNKQVIRLLSVGTPSMWPLFSGTTNLACRFKGSIERTGGQPRITAAEELLASGIWQVSEPTSLSNDSLSGLASGRSWPAHA